MTEAVTCDCFHDAGARGRHDSSPDEAVNEEKRDRGLGPAVRDQFGEVRVRVGAVRAHADQQTASQFDTLRAGVAGEALRIERWNGCSHHGRCFLA